ncbi:MAG: TetR/AcrR family transcriptional regulator [Breznakibacter sp.]
MTEQTQETQTREAILLAARQEFTEKGLNGARMQEIANRAGINKALLHYYFKTKENLFDCIFNEAFNQFWPVLNSALIEKMTLKTFMERVVVTYIDMLLQHPYLPIFVLNELHHNPERLQRLIKESGFDPNVLLAKIESEIAEGKCHPFNPAEMVINIISLSIFPFAAKPLIQRIWFENDPERYTRFLQERKHSLLTFLERAIFV